MRITVKRLRFLIIGLALLLVAVVVGFLGYARYRIRHIGKDLPGKLGIDIERTADGYTASRSEKGHTTFTIHASKLVTFKSNGHAVLHDVAITLYGPPGSNRQDHIYGNDFDYDQKNGIATAQGDVQIDMDPPGDTPAAKQDDGNDDAKKTIHIKASGMVFDQKTGIATTENHVEFFLPKAAGQSEGANFDSKQGILILNRQVVFTSSMNGQPVVVHATHAQLLRDSRQAFLLNAESEFRDEHSTAQQAVIYFRKDGSAEKLNAKGNVHTVMDNGAEVTSQTLNADLDEKSQPTQAVLGGGVNFISKDDQQAMHGNAVEGTLTFANSQLKHAQFRNAVSFVDQQLKLPNDPNGSATRQVQASKLDVDFVPGTNGKAVAQKALATGNATATLRSTPSKAPQQNTLIGGDQLLATLAPDGHAIKQLDGSGHTKITDLKQDGSSSLSTGDVLHMTFVPPTQEAAAAAKQKKSADAAQTAQIDTAIQEGNVTLTQTPAKDAKPVNGAPPQPLHAFAIRAEYHSSDQILHLTGNPRINNGSIDMSAQLIDYHRDSGDATAKGDVRGTYLQSKQGPNQGSNQQGTLFGGQGPVHIVAAEGELHHATDDSVFRGQARMWQDADSVAAPVIELSRTQQTLHAHGEAGQADQVVNTAISSLMGSKKTPSVVRVKSKMLDYSDKDRRGDFEGNVSATNPDGVIHSDHAQFLLLPSQKTGVAKTATTPGTSSSQIDKIIATGHVVITQPGRKGEGEKLVYTAQDGHYVLTGTALNPPHVTDAARGTTTGSALIFNDQDDSVEVSGGQAAAVTTTRAPK